jgi:hypothetical protein
VADNPSRAEFVLAMNQLACQITMFCFVEFEFVTHGVPSSRTIHTPGAENRADE